MSAFPKKFFSWWTLENTKSFFTLLASATALVVALSAVFFLSRAEIELDQPQALTYIDPALLQEQGLSPETAEVAVDVAGFYNEHAWWGPFFLPLAGITSIFDEDTSACTSDWQEALRQIYGTHDCLDVPIYAPVVLARLPAEDHVQALTAFEHAKRFRFDVQAWNSGTAVAYRVVVFGPSGYEPVSPEMPFDLPPGDAQVVSFVGQRLDIVGLDLDSMKALTESQLSLIEGSLYPSFDVQASSVINYSAILVVAVILGLIVLAVLIGQIWREWRHLGE